MLGMRIKVKRKRSLYFKHKIPNKGISGGLLCLSLSIVTLIVKPPGLAQGAHGLCYFKTSNPEVELVPRREKRIKQATQYGPLDLLI